MSKKTAHFLHNFIRNKENNARFIALFFTKQHKKLVNNISHLRSDPRDYCAAMHVEDGHKKVFFSGATQQ